MNAWFEILANLSEEIHRQKQEFVSTSPFRGIGKTISILVLELCLAIIALPLYFFYDTAKTPPSFFNQTGCAYSLYRLRKRVTVSVAMPTMAFIAIYFYFASGVQAITITWDNSSGDGLWSTATNWSTDTVPGSTDVVLFNDTSVTNATIDPAFQGTVAGVTIEATYSGTITQSRSLTVNGPFTMDAGTFLGNSDIIDINDVFTQTAGTFRASSATTSFSTHFRPTGGTFAHNDGTILFDGTGDSFINFATSSASVLYLNNLTVNRTLSSDGIQYEDLSDSAARIVVSGTAHFARGVLRAYLPPGSGLSTYIFLDAHGPVIHDSTWGGGQSIIRVFGPARVLEFPPDANLSRIDLFSTGTVANFNGTGTTTINTMGIFAGTFNQNDANLRVTNAISGQSAVAFFNGGPGNVQTEAVEATNGAQLTFGSGDIQVGVFVRLSGTTGSLIDFSQARSLTLRQYSAASTLTVLSVNTGSIIRLPPIPIVFDYRTTSIIGTVDAASTTLLLTRNGSQAILSSHDLTFGGITKIATNSQEFFFPAGVTTTINGALTLQGTSSTALLSIRSSLNSSAASAHDVVQASINPIGTRDIRFLQVIQNRNIHPTLIDASGQYAIDRGRVDGWFGMIDLTDPTTPGDLTVAERSQTSARLVFGTPSSDANFSDYRIFYRPDLTPPTTTDSRVTSSTESALATSTYGGATGIVLSGLARSSVYTVNIWAYDEYGNYASGTPTAFYTLPNPVSDAGVSNITPTEMTVSWGTNGNDQTTQYQVYDTDDPSRTSGWTGATSFRFTGLNNGQSYSFTIVARDVNNQEASISGGPFSTLSVGGFTPTPPPPINPSPSGGGGGGANSNGPAITINDGDPTTPSRNVTLTFDVPSADQIAVSNLPDLADASYEPYVNNMPWVLTPGFGMKTVFARFRTNVGGQSDASDTIEYIDSAAPPPPTPNPPPPTPTPTPTTPNPPPPTPNPTPNPVTPNPPPPTPTPTPTTPNPPPPSPGPGATPPAPAPTPTPSGGGSTGGGSTNPTPPPPAGGIAPTPPPSTPEVPGETTEPEEETPLPELPLGLESTPPPAPTPPPSQSPQPQEARPQRIPQNIAEAVVFRAEETYSEIVSVVTEVRETEEVRQVARVTAPVATTISTIAVTSSLWTIITPLLRFLFLQPLMFLGLRKKEVWGEVYDTDKKLPVDLAIVRLIDEGNGKVIQTRVTDMHGRYLFTPKAGTYRLEVVKDGFVFPSSLLDGREADGRHTDLYYGTPIVTTADGEPIAKSIALDRAGSHKVIRSRFNFNQPLRALQQGMAMAGAVATGVSFTVTPNLKTFGFVLVHVGLGILFYRYAKVKTPKRSGAIIDAHTHEAVAGAVVRLYNESLKKLVDTKITNEKGEYVFLVGGGSYRLIVEKRGYLSVSIPLNLPTSIEAGAITKNITLSRGESSGEDASASTLPNINLVP